MRKSLTIFNNLILVVVVVAATTAETCQLFRRSLSITIWSKGRGQDFASDGCGLEYHQRRDSRYAGREPRKQSSSVMNLSLV